MNKFFKLKEFIKKTEKFFEVKNYSMVIEYANKALSMEILLSKVQISEILLMRGQSFYFLGRYIESIGDFNKLIKLYPDDEEFYNSRGICLSNIGQFDSAMNDFNKAIQLNPNDSYFYNNKAVVFDELNRSSEALNEYQKAINLDRNNSLFFKNRAKAYLSLNKFKESNDDIKNAIKNFKDEGEEFKNKLFEDYETTLFNMRDSLIRFYLPKYLFYFFIGLIIAFFVPSYTFQILFLLLFVLILYLFENIKYKRLVKQTPNAFKLYKKFHKGNI